MEPFAWLSCPDPKLADALDYLAQHPGKQLRSRLTVASAELVAPPEVLDGGDFVPEDDLVLDGGLATV